MERGRSPCGAKPVRLSSLIYKNLKLKKKEEKRSDVAEGLLLSG
jgi:hypothetical protein